MYYERLTVSVFEGTKDKLDALMDEYPGRFANHSHIVRSAISVYLRWLKTHGGSL